MCCPYHGDGELTLHSATSAGVRLIPLVGEVDGKLIKDGPLLHFKEAIQRNYKSRDVAHLLGSRLQVLMLIFLLRYLETFLHILLQLGGDVSVHGVHVVNTAHTLLPEVSVDKVALLLQIIKSLLWVYL